jgi:tungstate transport system permease protein
LNTLASSFAAAFGMIVQADPALLGVIGLSLRVSLCAVFIATLIGAPLGALVAVARFPGQRTAIVVLNGLMGLPPVVIGLLVYLLLSRAGPLGELGLLFTPGAMIVAQTILITPIIAALTRQVVADAWVEYRELLGSLRATLRQSVVTLLWDSRYALSTVVLAGLGRAMSEVGAVIIVGGNIAGVTRVMTTTIALETSKGDLPLALALGLILILLVMLLNAAAYATREWTARHYG